jgi:hypothetical protein
MPESRNRVYEELTLHQLRSFRRRGSFLPAAAEELIRFVRERLSSPLPGGG